MGLAKQKMAQRPSSRGSSANFSGRAAARLPALFFFFFVFSRPGAEIRSVPGRLLACKGVWPAGGSDGRLRNFRRSRADPSRDAASVVGLALDRAGPPAVPRAAVSFSFFAL